VWPAPKTKSVLSILHAWSIRRAELSRSARDGAPYLGIESSGRPLIRFWRDSVAGTVAATAVGAWRVRRDSCTIMPRLTNRIAPSSSPDNLLRLSENHGKCILMSKIPAWANDVDYQHGSRLDPDLFNENIVRVAVGLAPLGAIGLRLGPHWSLSSSFRHLLPSVINLNYHRDAVSRAVPEEITAGFDSSFSAAGARNTLTSSSAAATSDR